MQYITNIFGQAYGSGNYNSSTYEGSSSAATSAAAGGSKSGGLLTNTGFDAVLVVTLACIIMLAAVLVRFWKRPGKQKSS